MLHKLSEGLCYQMSIVEMPGLLVEVIRCRTRWLRLISGRAIISRFVRASRTVETLFLGVA